MCLLTALLPEHQFQGEARAPRHRKRHIFCLPRLFCPLCFMSLLLSVT